MTESSRICTRSLYIRVRTVASVARTQIFLYPHSTTASAHGTVTQRICRPRNTSCCMGRSAWTLAVLQAMMITSAHRSQSLWTPAYVSARISSSLFHPYGAFARSISRIILISGNSRRNASITTCHPSHESKKPRMISFFCIKKSGKFPRLYRTSYFWQLFVISDKHTRIVWHLLGSKLYEYSRYPHRREEREHDTKCKHEPKSLNHRYTEEEEYHR